ncbi:hypothetical protein JKY72_05280 [Candidatus Gracilibacteria bacterium]|nr:hypothetical protein [Candidatus Gracilibacteria bacterium]
MKNVIEFADYYRAQADEQPENRDLELVDASPEQLIEIADSINSAVHTATRVTGRKVARTKVDTLNGNIAGLYNIASNQTFLDHNIAETGDEQLTTHVLTHEAWHQTNKEEGDNVIITNSNFEEALTETATSETTGQILAYHEHMPLIDMVARQTSTTREKLIELFKEGHNAELNNLYEQAA